MKKDIVKKVGELAIATVFVLAVILFALAQYEFKSGNISLAEYNGFVMAFGEDNYEGFFVFFLPFLIAIIAASFIILSSFKVIKLKKSIVFSIVATLALLAAIFYIVTYSHTMDRYGKGELVDLSKNVKWLFSFWGAFALYCIALISSIYMAFISFKPHRRSKRK